MEGERWYKVRITPELLDTMLTRDHDGNALTYAVSEPDREGFRDITISTNFDDNLCEHLKCCGNCEHWWDDHCHAPDESSFATAPHEACHWSPSRWQERER